MSGHGAATYILNNSRASASDMIFFVTTVTFNSVTMGHRVKRRINELTISENESPRSILMCRLPSLCFGPLGVW